MENNNILTGNPVFKCANFEKFIRWLFNKPDGEITAEDMAKRTGLSIQDFRGVTDITGIEFCVNLRKLTLEFAEAQFSTTHLINQLLILNRLSRLESLTLRISDCEITEFNHLGNLTNLKELGYIIVKFPTFHL